jgi:ABC-2 type transport system ATP-binding protein
VPVVEVQGLSKRYGAVQALRSVDVVVEHGCTGLVGSNGAGKSTLLKLLLGLIAPDQGSATVLGHDVATDPLGARARVGYLPEGSCLPPDVTAADFVTLMGQLGGLPPRAARERSSEICYQVGLEEERYRTIGGFSTGMQQRVKLAVALVHDPRLLLLDEPTDGMDPQGREDMLALIDRARGELEVDVLVSTHLLGDVERICDRVVMVHAGQVLVQGPIRAVAGTSEAGFATQLGDNGPQVRAALEGAGLGVRAVGDVLEVQGGVDAANRLRDVAAERGWPLRRLTPKAPSLEETFLRLQAAASSSTSRHAEPEQEPSPEPSPPTGVTP